MPYLILALFSGMPALVYEVVWTREVALVVGGQVEATSLVLAAFFAGLALGARWLGRTADRARSPLRLYAALEAAAGASAAGSLLALRTLGSSPALLSLALPLQLLLCGALLLPVSLLLGGALPALLRAAEDDAGRAPRTAGRLVGANTAGAVLGVALATIFVPTGGLRATLHGAALGSFVLGALAFAWSGRGPASARVAAPLPDRDEGLPRLPLVAAGLAGAATLAFEVLAARMAALQLGSTLFAWSGVLGLLLAGLALGNAIFASRAARTPQPERDLGWIETGAAAALGAGLVLLGPRAALPSQGLTPATLTAVTLAVFPAAVLMGGAFPFFVRLALRGPASLGRAFGTVSAVNTAGGVAGSLAAPFFLIPVLGLLGGALACAGLNASLGVAFLLVRGEARAGLRAASAAAIALGCAWPALARGPGEGAGRLIFLAHGRQASAAVVRTAARRDLLVDGDPEASTAGAARATEELLALLPLALHPQPQGFLEVGLGSGITLGTAAELPLERIECVEISGAVIAAAPYFAPDNGAAAAGHDPRLRVHRADGRAHLAQHRDTYDVVVANTLHPWSLGATGLYSREYFTRMAASLRPGGLAVQWLPLQRIGAEHLAAILRTFFDVFPHGDLWWGAENLLVVGSAAPPPAPDPRRLAALPRSTRNRLARLGIDDAASLAARRVADAASVRRALGPGETLSDDRPALETRALLRRGRPGPGAEFALVSRIAETAAASGRGDGLLRLWLESRALRMAGEVERADRLEVTAADAGLGLARAARAAHIRDEAGRARSEGHLREAARLYRSALATWPRDPRARFALAVTAFEQDDLTAASAELERLVAERPDDAQAWNLLGVVRSRSGDAAGASAALARALEADPFFPEVLANAGLLAIERDDVAGARVLLERLRRLEVGRASKQRRSLEEAVARAS